MFKFMVNAVVGSVAMATGWRQNMFKPEISRIFHPKELEQSPSCVRRHFVCFGNEDPKRSDRVYTPSDATVDHRHGGHCLKRLLRFVTLILNSWFAFPFHNLNFIYVPERLEFDKIQYWLNAWHVFREKWGQWDCFRHHFTIYDNI